MEGRFSSCSSCGKSRIGGACIQFDAVGLTRIILKRPASLDGHRSHVFCLRPGAAESIELRVIAGHAGRKELTISPQWCVCLWMCESGPDKFGPSALKVIAFLQLLRILRCYRRANGRTMSKF